MVSDKPRPDRCAAKVVDNVGLEITLEDDTTITDEQFDSVLLSDGDLTIEGEPTYSTIREHLWNDYDPIAIAISPGTELSDSLDGGERSEGESGLSQSDTTGKLVGVDAEVMDVDGDNIGADSTVGSPGATEDHTWLDITSCYENVTNRTSTLQGYCERYEMNDKNRCYVHKGGNGPGEGNTNSIKHGLYAQRTNYYKALGEEDREFVEAMVDSWLEQAPYGRDNKAMVNELYRAAIDQHRAWGGIDSYVGEDGEIQGLTDEFEQETESGEVIEVEMEQPQNIAYSRLDGDVRQKLRDHGIYDDPESQKADATMSLAKKLSGQD